MAQSGLKGFFKSRAALHTYLWLFYFLTSFLESGDREIPVGTRLARNIVFIATMIPPIYVHFHFFDRFFLKRRYALYILSVITTVAVFGYITHIVAMRINAMSLPVIPSMVYLAIFLGIATALRLAKSWHDQRFALQEMQARQLATELELLKSQINPHFLFNTLNNLFGIVRRSDERAARGIATLSHLMRYMIHESRAERVPLGMEVEQIERFIELQRLRFSEDDDIEIEFDRGGAVDGVLVPPMLFIPFVENAFKHGIRLKRRSYIRIAVEVSDGVLRFTARNSLHGAGHAGDVSREGIGLENVKRRLDLIYGGRHALDIRQENDEYAVTLDIELKEGQS